jgi:hypothetical protein
MELFPFIPPNTDKFEALWAAARDKWGESADDMGYVGNDGTHAFFQVRGDNTNYKLPLTNVNA